MAAPPPSRQQCSLAVPLAAPTPPTPCCPPTARAALPAFPLLCAGTLQRDFKHLAVDMFLTEEEGKKVLKVDCHFGKRKSLASIRTCTSHVQVSCQQGGGTGQRL